MKQIFALITFSIFTCEVWAQEQIRVASYNIKGLPFPIQINHTPRYKRIVKELRKMHEAKNAPDVILIQEAFSLFSQYVYFKLNDIYPYRVRGPKGRIRINSGLEILSRYPISKSATIVYNQCDSVDCLSRKGVLHARINNIDFYNTHMQANNKSRKEIANKVRIKQTETMIQFVKNTRDENLPFFMVGDFNTRPSNVNYGRFMEEFGDIDTRIYCQTHNSCPNFESMPNTYWDEKIDHIFYGSAEPLDYQQFFHETNYSDHDMIMGTFMVISPPTNLNALSSPE